LTRWSSLFIAKEILIAVVEHVEVLGIGVAVIREQRVIAAPEAIAKSIALIPWVITPPGKVIAIIITKVVVVSRGTNEQMDGQ
jgi:hypothetical protein